MTLKSLLMDVQWLGECREQNINLLSVLGIDPQNYFAMGTIDYDEQARLKQDIIQKQQELTEIIKPEQDLPLGLNELGEILSIDITKARGLLTNTQLYTNPNPRQASSFGTFVDLKDYTMAMKNSHAEPHTLSYIIESYVQAREAIRKGKKDGNESMELLKLQHEQTLQGLKEEKERIRKDYEKEKVRLNEEKKKAADDLVDILANHRVELATERKAKQEVETKYKTEIAGLDKKYSDLEATAQERILSLEKDYDARVKELTQSVERVMLTKTGALMVNLLDKTKEVDSLKRDYASLDSRYKQLTADLEVRTRELGEVRLAQQTELEPKAIMATMADDWGRNGYVLIKYEDREIKIGEVGALLKELRKVNTIYLQDIPSYLLLEAMIDLKDKNLGPKIIYQVNSDVKQELKEYMLRNKGTQDVQELEGMVQNGLLINPEKFNETFWGSAIYRQQCIMKIADDIIDNK